MVNNNLLTYSKIRVEWSDRPENYNKESILKIKNHFSKKYGVNKDNINVIYKPVKFNDKGDLIQIDGATIDNIMDINYQRSLFKEWLEREKNTTSLDLIYRLDDKINGKLADDITPYSNNSWKINWIMLDNFLSFGSKNYLDFNKLNGLVIVNSEPNPNQGGKSTLVVDGLKFLLYGNTTKTDKNEEVFNQYTDKNEVIVRGSLIINNEEFIIERKLKRTTKKAGGYTITNTVEYYNILPDGEEKLMVEEDAKMTTKKIREVIGTESDFEMVILATANNLESLIDSTTTESGKLLTKFIGLEVIEKKEIVARELYNEFNKTKKGNHYNVVTLLDEINTHEENNKMLEASKLSISNKLDDVNKTIVSLTKEKDDLLSSKEKIDVEIISLNPSKLEEKIKDITNKGLILKEKKINIEKDIKSIPNNTFDEKDYIELTKDVNNSRVSIGIIEDKIYNTKINIKNLIESGICKECNRPLDKIDNTNHINEHNKTINEFEDALKIKKEELNEYLERLTKLDTIKQMVDKKNKLELENDRIDVEISQLRNELVSKRNDLNKYNLNLKTIEYNKNVDGQIEIIKTKLNVSQYERDQLKDKLVKIDNETTINTDNILSKKELIKQLKREEEIEKVFKVYIDLVGKKGISKLVLRSVLPILNSEISRLLEDICDFNVEIFIDDKNNVQFIIDKDQVSKSIKSGSGFERTTASLALRSVLGKMCKLPMPNFITFDEVLGKVAEENIHNMKLLFDKIKNMYNVVFLITHNNLVKDWASNIITVRKENNISRIL